MLTKNSFKSFSVLSIFKTLDACTLQILGICLHSTPKNSLTQFAKSFAKWSLVKTSLIWFRVIKITQCVGLAITLHSRYNNESLFPFWIGRESFSTLQIILFILNRLLFIVVSKRKVAILFLSGALFILSRVGLFAHVSSFVSLSAADFCRRVAERRWTCKEKNKKIFFTSLVYFCAPLLLLHHTI